MCLHLPLSKDPPPPRVALEDLQVYKIMVDTVDGLFSPFHQTQYRIGEVLSTELDEPEYRRVYRDRKWLESRCWVINKGLHSFVSFESTQRMFSKLGGKLCWTLRVSGDIKFEAVVVFTAVIPKGSLYYEGDDGDIASNQLQLLERVTL